jgi:small ligand-binding sensory domain FIST
MLCRRSRTTSRGGRRLVAQGPGKQDGDRAGGTRAPGAGAPAAATALVQSANWRLAVDVVLHKTLDGATAPPDLVLLFASSELAPDYPRILHEIYQRSGTGCLVGSSSGGVLANATSVESGPCLAMMALWLPGATLTPIRLHQAMLDLLDDAEGAPSSGPRAEDTRALLLFADPFRLDVQETVVRLAARYPGVPMMGAAASSSGQDRRVWVFFDDQVFDEGGVAVAIGGPYDLRIVVSQGADPIGDPWTITGVDRNLITTISNRPAVEVMRETIAALTPAERAGIERNLLLGFPIDEYQEHFHRGDFVTRGMLGLDEERGALIVGSIPRLGQTIQFQRRDAHSSSLDLQQMLVDARAMVADEHLVAGILCTCKGRGSGMFGRADHDSAAVRAAFRTLPFAGLFAWGEIGPVHGRSVLNSFTAVLGLLTYRAR